MFPELDLYYTDPAQLLASPGEELHHLDHDLFDVFNCCYTWAPKRLEVERVSAKFDLTACFYLYVHITKKKKN